jgi:hypothetical protein
MPDKKTEHRSAGKGNFRYLIMFLIITMLFTCIPVNFNSVRAANENNAPASGGPTFEIAWSSTFGGMGYDEAYSVISIDKTNEEDEVEEGYIFTGTISDDAGLEHTALVKTDKEGNLIWERQFGGYFYSVGYSVAQTRDGGFIIAGISKTTMQSNDKIYVIKTDANGNREWDRHLDLAEQGYSNTKRQAYSIKETDDGYIIAGSVIYGGTSDALIIKINPDGIVTWAQTFGGMGWDCFYDIELVSDGYIAAGYTEDPNKLEYIVKIGSYGEFIWEYKGVEAESQVKDLIITEDGNIVATGYRNASVSLLKLGIDGISYWGNVYGQGTGYGVIQLASGDYVIAGYDMAVGVKANGNKSWEMDLKSNNCYARSVTSSKSGNSSGSMVFAGYKSVNNSDAVLFELASARAFLGVSSPNIIKGGTVYLYCPLFLKNGELDKTGSGDVRVKITSDPDDGEETWVTLSDGDPAVIDDFEILDGIYCGSYNVKGSGSPGINPSNIKVELYVDGIKEDSKTIEVISDPDLVNLVVLTDYKQLYKEFLDTGMARGEDKNTNRVPDFYDLMERIKKYAEDHKGTVFDVSKEITTEKGYQNNYFDFSYDNRDAVIMGVAIDEFIKNISQVAKFKHVAIIGDDEVIPFYRRADPTREPNPQNKDEIITYEQEYVPRDMRGNDWGNPTLLDSANGNIMTDILYGSYSNDNPQQVYFPIPDAGVGRIFADNASTLIEMIDGFETPINVIPEMSKVIILGLDSDFRDMPDGVDFPECIKRAIIPGINTKYKRDTKLRIVTTPSAIRNGYYYWYDGELQDWSGKHVAEAVNEANIVMIWSHAEHIRELTQGYKDLTYLDLQYMKPSPGHIIINAGCHSGYSVSHNNSFKPYETYKPYDETMAKTIISKQVGYLAPSVYGLGANDFLYAHDLLESEFIRALVNYGGGTVGDKLKAAYWNYRSGCNYTHSDEAVYAVYGTIYYGLPTQKVVTTVEELAALQNAAQVQELQANKANQSNKADDNFKPAKANNNNASFSINRVNGINTFNTIAAGSISNSMEISVDIPEFKKIRGKSGKIFFEIPNSNNYLKTTFAPMIPMVTKTYILPKNSIVSDVSLENQSYTHFLLEENEELELLLPISKTHGVMYGEPIELTNPYPQEIYTWNLEERQDGVYLNINITPMQYNPETKQVTLYNKIDLNVDYSVPASTAGIEEVIINNNSSVIKGMSDLPVSVKVNSDSVFKARMEWIIRDSSGELIETGRKSVGINAGENQLSFSFDTEDWTSGKKDITILLKNAPSGNEQLDEDFPIASYFSVMPVTGLNLNIDMNEKIIEPSENKAVFSAEVRDENGIGVTGIIVDKFIVKVDETILSNVVMSEAGEGTYSFEFGISGLSEDMHQLNLTCNDGGGRSAYAEEYFVIRTDNKPPEVTSTSPSMHRSGVGLNEKITIQFDEKIFPGTEYDSIQLKKLSADSDIEVDVEIEKFIDLGKLTITPVSLLELNSIYKVVLPAGAVMDKNANELIKPYSLSFITYAEPDETSPYLVSTVPSESEGTFLQFSQKLGDEKMRDGPSDFTETKGDGPSKMGTDLHFLQKQEQH